MQKFYPTWVSILEKTNPRKRVGFLESLYIQGKQTSDIHLKADIISLLKRFSTNKRSYQPLINKLRKSTTPQITSIDIISSSRESIRALGIIDI